MTFDQDQIGRATMRTGGIERFGWRSSLCLRCRCVRRLGIVLRRTDAEKPPGLCDLLLTLVIAQQSIVADLYIAWGQDVQGEAAQELRQRKRHDFAPVMVCIVFIGEAHGALLGVEGEEAAVADGHAMGVAGEVGEHLARPPEGTLSKDNPLLA